MANPFLPGNAAAVFAGGRSGAALPDVPAKPSGDAGSLFPGGIGSDFLTCLEPTELMLAAGFEPDDWQPQVMRFDGPRLLVNCARQTGKTTVTACKAVHKAMFEPQSLVLVGSPSLRQSQEFMLKVRNVFHALPKPPEIVDESALKMTLANGSRLVALPGNSATVRGFSAAALIIIDEASRVENSLYEVLRPTLATSAGQFIALSTPAGKRGWWADAWHSATQGWTRIRVPASECPRINAEWLAQERDLLGAWVYAQEYECQFCDDESQLFSSALIQAAITDTVKPLWA